jgi:hypothetical protein
MSIDIIYFFITCMVVIIFSSLVFFYEYYRFKKWLKAMNEREEAEPFNWVEPKRTKRELIRYNRVMRNIHNQLNAK